MRNFFLLLAGLLINATLFSQSVNINTQLVAYFPFNNCSDEDASGLGSFAAIDSTILCSCGASGEALEFDNASEDARFGGNINSVFTTSNFTISFYMKPGIPVNPASTQLVMSKQDSCDQKNAFWVRYRKQGQTSQSSNVLSTGISQNDTLSVTLSTKLDDDRCWYHVVIVRDGVKYQLFVDGVLRDQKSSPIRIDLNNPAPLVISRPQCSIDAAYFGKVDELRMYNRAYNETEIKKFLAFNPDKILTQDTLIYLGNSFKAEITSTCANNFIWSPLDGLSSHTVPTPLITPTETTTYLLRFNHPDGCDAFDTLRVNVIDPDTLDCSQIFLPNAFTPGFSAGKNDRFYISNAFAITDFISFEIFDRWGGRVFNAASVSDYWDGTFGGSPVNPGIFLYRLRYNCKGEEKVRSGTVTLLR